MYIQLSFLDVNVFDNLSHVSEVQCGIVYNNLFTYVPSAVPNQAHTVMAKGLQNDKAELRRPTS